jgi:hypothetical protein
MFQFDVTKPICKKKLLTYSKRATEPGWRGPDWSGAAEFLLTGRRERSRPVQPVQAVGATAGLGPPDVYAPSGLYGRLWTVSFALLDAVVQYVPVIPRGDWGPAPGGHPMAIKLDMGIWDAVNAATHAIANASVLRPGAVRRLHGFTSSLHPLPARGRDKAADSVCLDLLLA